MTELNKAQASALLASKVELVEALIKECTDVADEHGLQFHMSLGGAANVDRNIAGEYYGKGSELNSDGKYELSGQYNDFEVPHEQIGEADEWGDTTVRLTEGAWSAWQSSSEEC